MKILRIGDPHTQIKNLKDSEKLVDFVIEVASCSGVHVVEFLGDLFHNHAVLRVEVVDFWQKTFDKLEALPVKVRVLVGNHDQPGSKEKEQEINALNIFKDTKSRTIINKPMKLDDIGYIPYMSDEESFIAAAQDLYDQGAIGLLVAHQTFTGAQYENGFFSEEGIDPALLPQAQILSGHIHMTQQIGKCFYPGTPKWDTMSDANQEKGIWIFTHDETGMYTSKEFISTRDVVTPITSFVVKEGDELPTLNPDARNYVTLEGKSAWITKTKKKFKDIAQIKVKPTDRRVIVNKENTETIDKYLENEFSPIEGVSKKEIKQHLAEL